MLHLWNHFTSLSKLEAWLSPTLNQSPYLASEPVYMGKFHSGTEEDDYKDIFQIQGGISALKILFLNLEFGVS